VLTVVELQRRRAGQGTPWPARLSCFEVLGSTSDHLKQQAREGAPEWTAVLAGRQQAGRGRQGHGWVSPPGNLFLSVLLRPGAGVRAALLPLLAGVAVAEALEASAGVPVRLKWPNDVLVGERKIGGILVEASTGVHGLEWAVVGVGVNVALRPDDVPEDLREAVTSVAQEGGSGGVLPLAAAVLGRMALWYPARARGDAALVRDAWLGRSLPWWNRPVEARSGSTVLRGVARGLDEWGGLVLEQEGGVVTALRSGDVREVRLSPGSSS
jgi:BirA family transcriptional regulator, biotin operon repressor / biotin---[acetyl-CoA-carboxylase] ligase